MITIVDDIFDLFARFGSEGYGEDLSLEQHMLQSAALAQSLGASPNAVAAALLHDIGYFLRADAGGAADPGQDFEHEALGAAWLSRGFGEAVTAPVALHVEAKRYLCLVEPGYFDQLSDASKLSLSVQGGVMNRAEAAAFEALPTFDSAILLRRCDDRGKDMAAEVRPLRSYRTLLVGCLRESAD